MNYHSWRLTQNLHPAQRQDIAVSMVRLNLMHRSVWAQTDFAKLCFGDFQFIHVNIMLEPYWCEQIDLQPARHTLPYWDFEHFWLHIYSVLSLSANAERLSSKLW